MREKILEIINEKRAYYAGGIPLLSLAGDTTSLQDAANTRAIEITYSYVEHCEIQFGYEYVSFDEIVSIIEENSPKIK